MYADLFQITDITWFPIFDNIKWIGSLMDQLFHINLEADTNTIWRKHIYHITLLDNTTQKQKYKHVLYYLI